MRLNNLFFGLLLLSMPGCGATCAYQPPVYFVPETSQSVLVIPVKDVKKQKTTDEALELDFKNYLVNTQRITIPFDWRSTSRIGMSGQFVPTVKLIVIDRQKETRVWLPESKDSGIWVESRDSVDFSTGITITAHIENDEAALKFLHHYKPNKQLDVATLSGYNVFKADITSLKYIMDTEVYGRIQTVFAEESAKYKMDELRTKKNEIVTAVRSHVVEYFKNHGITIDNIGMQGGFTYKDARIQEAINNVFKAQQDKEVAIAESDAAKERKNALELQGEGEAARKLKVSQGEAQGIKAIADAKSYEISKLKEDPQSYLLLKRLKIEKVQAEKWSGILPTWYFSGEKSAIPLLSIPIENNKK